MARLLLAVAGAAILASTRPAILSPGYGVSHTDYAFIATHLASRGSLLRELER